MNHVVLAALYLLSFSVTIFFLAREDIQENSKIVSRVVAAPRVFYPAGTGHVFPKPKMLEDMHNGHILDFTLLRFNQMEAV